MSDKITSHNQSGGITAKNVSAGGDAAFSAPPPRRPKPMKTLAALLGALAAITAILTFFGIGPLGNIMSNDRPIFEVNSINQQGGITAGQVNISPQPRRLTEANMQQLRQNLPRNKKVTVVAVMGDGEAFNFAQQIRDFLAQDGEA